MLCDVCTLYNGRLPEKMESTSRKTTDGRYGKQTRCWLFNMSSRQTPTIEATPTETTPTMAITPAMNDHTKNDHITRYYGQPLVVIANWKHPAVMQTLGAQSAH